MKIPAVTPFFASIGLTRDWLGWAWLKIVSLATLVLSQAVDLHGWATYLGIPLSETGVHWILTIAAIVMFVAGSHDSSALPAGAPKLKSPVTPTVAGLMLLPLMLGALTLPGCGQTTRHVATVTVTTEHSVLAGLQDLSTQNFCGAATAAPAPACIDHATRLKIDAFFQSAFAKDAQVAQLVRDTPTTAAPNTAALVGDISTLIADVIQVLPSSLQTKANALFSGGQ